MTSRSRRFQIRETRYGYEPPVESRRDRGASVIRALPIPADAVCPGPASEQSELQGLRLRLLAMEEIVAKDLGLRGAVNPI